jgi:hypothetical protein
MRRQTEPDHVLLGAQIFNKLRLTGILAGVEWILARKYDLPLFYLSMSRL